MTPTPEQLAIIAAARDSTANLLVEADAGAAKTSSLVLIAEALPQTQILCLAFNKKIATEMKERLPANCTAMTLNSLGHRVWGEATGRRLRVEPSKTFDLVKSFIDESGPADKTLLYKSMGDLMRTIDFGKACGYIPSNSYMEGPQRAKRLMDDDDFFDHLDDYLSDVEIDCIRTVTLQGLAQAWQGLCDYNDQILMPTVFVGAFPRYPLVMVDEAQDLSTLNHATLRKLAYKRLIAVGDPAQAIYGFRGAHEDSMTKLRDDFNMTPLTLSVSFRCPIAIVNHVHWRKPNMTWPDWAKPGEVRTLSYWSASDIPEDAVIICRNNAPIFACAIKLLRHGRRVEIAGNDVGKSLLKIMKSFGVSQTPRADVLFSIERWAEERIEKSKSRAKAGIEDRAACMRVFVEQGENLGDALAYAEHIFQQKSALKLMTGHKSKGLEFNDVFFLDEHLVSDEGQDRNLRYVIATRAKERLTYIKLEDFND